MNADRPYVYLVTRGDQIIGAQRSLESAQASPRLAAIHTWTRSTESEGAGVVAEWHSVGEPFRISKVLIDRNTDDE